MVSGCDPKSLSPLLYYSNKARSNCSTIEAAKNTLSANDYMKRFSTLAFKSILVAKELVKSQLLLEFRDFYSRIKRLGSVVTTIASHCYCPW